MASSRETVLVLCLGCGKDITHRKDDRRALQGTAEARTVINAWRELLELSEIEDEEERLLADALTAEDVSQEKMCRKCFSGFGRYMKLQTTLRESLLKAVQSQVTRQAQEHGTASLRKRPRLDASQSAVSYQQPQSLEETSSPSVSVRNE